MVGLEPAEACLDFAPDGPRPKVLKRTLLAVRQCSTLGEDVYVISTPFDSLANDLFSAPPSIERGRVDPVHTLVNGSIHSRMADCSSCRPQYTCQLVVEPIGAV